jgi:alpha-mannosidase
MTDVPEHTWMMATLLKHAGIDFMMIGCNGASAPLKVPLLYWWQGPDGSRVLTFYSPRIRHPARPAQGLALSHLAGLPAHRR